MKLCSTTQACSKQHSTSSMDLNVYDPSLNVRNHLHWVNVIPIFQINLCVGAWSVKDIKIWMTGKSTTHVFTLQVSYVKIKAAEGFQMLLYPVPLVKFTYFLLNIVNPLPAMDIFIWDFGRKKNHCLFTCHETSWFAVPYTL